MAQLATTFVHLKDYLKWAGEQGCRVQTGFTEGPDGMEEFTVITAPSGRYVVIHGLRPDEAIPLYAYEYYDRRLGLHSPDNCYGAAGIRPFG